MATIQARIEAYIGSITSSTSALEDVMQSERAFIIRNAPTGLIAGYATESVVTADLTAISGDYRLFSVFNRTSETYATQTRPSNKFRDSDSLLYVTSESPKYAVEMDSSTVTALYPSGDSFAVRYARYDEPVSISGSSFTNIPPDAEEIIIYKACISELSFRQGVAIKDLETALYDSKITDILTIDYAGVVSALADDDFEKVQSELSYITTQINEYTKGLETTQAEMSDAANTYTDGINRLSKRLESINAERASIAALYQQELQKIGAVSRQVQQ